MDSRRQTLDIVIKMLGFRFFSLSLLSDAYRSNARSFLKIAQDFRSVKGKGKAPALLVGVGWLKVCPELADSLSVKAGAYALE